MDRTFLYRHRDLLARIHALEAVPPAPADGASPAVTRTSLQADLLGAPADIDTLSQKITHLEQQAIDLQLQLGERDDDLVAVRAANRELMAQLNATTRRP